MENLIYQWPQGKKCAVSLSFDFDGESPYLWRTRNTPSNMLGEWEQRRFGPRQGIYRILDILKKYEVRATFFIPGVIAEKYPQAVEQVAKHGHEIGLHGYLHERVDQLTKTEVEETFTKSKEIFERLLGKKTFGYRSPSWEMTLETFEVLREHNIIYDSSMMGYDHPYWVDDLPEIPVQWLLDDAIFFRYTGGGPGSYPPQNPAVVMDAWKQEFEGMKRYGGLFLTTMHPWISGRASRLMELEQLILFLQRDSDVWWATCEEVAAYHRSHYPDQFRETIGVN
ncbi:polysaccharide deacetylase family protein [Paenibacillus agricola]|uniref:Polysaccharide deacetylase n=1 Tax=Paenibacillus agricola TaxID=2716264 RepID=A0ABX0J430_9BACL|nr:polysaccharide deacetylase [Paenibacillus agricola]NHN31085.1 polysaccharide deacetylase [Paenibacillus agricola]